MDITSPQPESPGETSAQGGSGRPATSTNRQYPIPPPYYEYFTDEAWGEYRRQQQRRGNAKGKGILGNDESVGEHVDGDNEDDDDAMIGDKDYQLDAATLEAFTPPRVDWIVEDGGWQAFGQTHTVKPHIFTAAELGIPDFRPPNVDLTQKEYMHLLLRSFLHTKLTLLKSLSETMRPVHEINAIGMGHQTEQYVTHLANLGATMMTISNELRPLQAQLTLEMMMRDQLDRRKQETRRLKEKTTLLTEKLKDLQGDMQQLVSAARTEQT